MSNYYLIKNKKKKKKANDSYNGSRLGLEGKFCDRTNSFIIAEGNCESFLTLNNVSWRWELCASGTRLLLGAASVGFPSGRHARCKCRRNELLTAHVVYNTQQVKDRLLLSMTLLQQNCWQRPWNLGRRQFFIIFAKCRSAGPGFLCWSIMVKSAYLLSGVRQSGGVFIALSLAIYLAKNRSHKPNPVNRTRKITWKRELLLLFPNFLGSANQEINVRTHWVDSTYGEFFGYQCDPVTIVILQLCSLES